MENIERIGVEKKGGLANKLDGKVMKFGEFVVLMAVMMSLMALSIDAMLPALSIIGDDLNVQNPNDNQLIISSMFLGLGFGQLVYGPISDSTGRKMPLYWGLSIFIVGSLISIFATSLTTMMVGRAVQGFGLASPRTLSTAMIRDQFEGSEMAKVMSFVMVIFILVPTIAPSLGQAVLLVADWKAIFVIILVFALCILLWFGMRMHETLVVEKRIPFSLKRIFSSIVEIFKTPRAINYTLTAGFVSSAFIGFLNTAQQIFQDQFELGAKFPLYFAALALSVGVASFFNGKMVMRYGMQQMVKTACCSMVSIALVFLLVMWAIDMPTPLWLTMVYFILTLFCIGILFGNMNSLALEPLGHIAGIGSAIVGSISTFVAVFFGTIIGQQYNGTILPVVLGFAIFGGISLLLIYWTERK